MVCGEDIVEFVINIIFLFKKIMLNIIDILIKKKLFFMYVNILLKDIDSYMKWYFIFSVYWLIFDYILD